MKHFICVTSIIALSGCATYPSAQTNYVPLVDTKNVSQEQFGIDILECNNYARAIDAEQAAQKAAVGVGLLAAALGAALGGNSRDIAQLGLIGAASGAVEGGNRAKEKKEDIVRRCMVGRNYKVLE